MNTARERLAERARKYHQSTKTKEAWFPSSRIREAFFSLDQSSQKSELMEKMRC